MTGEELNWFQIAVRVLFLTALFAYAAIVGTRLLGRIASLFRRGPRVVRLRKYRELVRPRD
ncbi:cadmium ABC transporter ATPase [Rhodopseudomonas palustris]|uniref:Cadmium ABC transporter ATPase n=1 Tax=Rhodopseudomonas palustris TaxID=1076 RepID=A0A323UBM6_RHOPL|nr:cadmium ABC transporter ATPase [Rhodopseudomonas palustris]PZA10262.1 cadmium ABC transporter ATPase [Rhodopseudomonas palustris]